MAFGDRKYPEDRDHVFVVEVLQTAGPQPWHEEAKLWRAEGFTVRECAKACGVSFGRMQRFLNPESKAKAKERQRMMELERRHNDPEYAEKSRTYIRRYMQQVAPGRARKGFQ